MDPFPTSARADDGNLHCAAADTRGAATRRSRTGRRPVGALLALPFLLVAGTAYAVDDASSGSAGKAAAADACARGNVLGAARVFGAASIPSDDFSKSTAHIFNRYSCSGDAGVGGPGEIAVKRLATGKYQVRFKNNHAQVATVTAEHSQLKASVQRDTADANVFNVELRDMVGPGDEGKFTNGTFHILTG